MKWIKASERLPVGIVGKPQELASKWTFETGNTQIRGTTVWQFLDAIKHLHDLTKVEWLDESPSPQGTGTGYTGATQSVEGMAEAYESLDDLWDKYSDNGSITKSWFDRLMEDFLPTLTHADQKGEGWIRVEDGLPEHGQKIIYEDRNDLVSGSQYWSNLKKSWLINIKRWIPYPGEQPPSPPGEQDSKNRMI